MGIFKSILKPFLLSIFMVVIHSGCSKTGEIFGIDIPRDNDIDNVINDSVYYPFQDQMCEWGFRTSGCKKENLDTNVSVEVNTTIPLEKNETKVCRKDEILVGEICFPQSKDSDKLKDVKSKWFDILTEAQQKSIQLDKNNILQNKDLTILTLLDLIPEDGLKMLKNTKVTLPYYIFNEKTDVQLAYVSSSNKDVISPNIIDSSNGAFKVVDSNSILFLELYAKGKIGESSSISLKVQEEDATKFDKEELNVSIVDGNETYNPVSLFFTYNTIIIEENDSRNIYFGISYTIDSNVTVVVRSDLEKILASDANTTLDLQNMNEANSIINASVENENGVPFYFTLEAKGKAGNKMDLFLVARDSKGKYDFKKFTVLIVAKGTADYQDNNKTTTPKTPSNPTISGDDFEKLNATQQALINDDNNNFDTGSVDKPIITTFNPETKIKLHKGESLTTSFYVKDSGKDTIYTNIYDDIKKIKASIENYGKYTITHSNKFFFLTLEAIGEVGDIVEITIRSQNANDDKLFDQESFKVEIVADDVESSYIEPLVYVGFNKLYIEEGGERTGLQFAIAHSKKLDPEITVADQTVAVFGKWFSKSPPKFSLKATGKSGSQTSMTISASDGIKTDERNINIYIIAKGQLQNYLDKEKEVDSNPTPDNKPKTCNDGFHIEAGKCVVDKTDPICKTGETLKNGKCISSSTGDVTVPTCGTGQHLDDKNQCVPDKTSITCKDGFELREDKKCYKIDSNQSVDPVCNDGYHLENNKCITDVTPISCDTGFNLKDGKCVSEDNKTSSDPICQDGYHLDNGSCIANVDDPICQTGFSLKNGKCISDNGGDTGTPTCKTGFHLEDNKCITDVTNPSCNEGYHLKDGKCVADDGKSDPITPSCEDGYSLKNNICSIDLVCKTGFHISNDVCISDTKTCEAGFHLDDTTDKCVKDSSPLVCTDGEEEKNGVCVSIQNRDNATLEKIDYKDWTENEKSAKSVEICAGKENEAGFTTLEATSVTAEGFSNRLGTLIIHSQKIPILNGVTQNVNMKLIYVENYTASPTSQMLDATFKIPKFRIDYTIEYSGSTFYLIDESNGKCYVNAFPSENTIPFGIIGLVKPDGK